MSMVDERLAAALTAWGLAHLPCTRLAGDVSRRRYYRLAGPELAAHGGTAVGMVTPLEELHKMHDWVAVGRYLASHGVPVPEVYRRDDPLAVMLVQDVGDTLLTLVHDPAAADAWYRVCLADLARIERAATREPADASPAHGRDLSEERIRWELRRFRKVVAGVLRDLSDAELALWKEGEDALVAALRGGPQAWMHRDLHARNLLVRHGRLWWVDFQDAMLGPWLYDVASLLFDPYAALPESRREALREDYLALPGRVHRDLGGRAVEAAWWTVATQRLVHCVACYVWVWEHDGKDTYLPYLNAAVRELRAAMGRAPAAGPLARVMAPRWDGLLERWSCDAVAR
ncbi:MAG: phosphotransferase [Armatimonadetes bacterium]|nr:phosphotransferase [Armatimonadota bacterium]